LSEKEVRNKEYIFFAMLELSFTKTQNLRLSKTKKMLFLLEIWSYPKGLSKKSIVEKQISMIEKKSKKLFEENI